MTSTADPTVYKILRITSVGSSGMQYTYTLGFSVVNSSAGGPNIGNDFTFVVGIEGDKGATGAKGQKGIGDKGAPGVKGDVGPAGFDFEYEHIALNPIARDEQFSSAGVSKHL